MIISKKVKREAKQLFRLCQLNGSLEENRMRQVVQYASASGYRETPTVLADFLRLVKLDREQHTAKVESATPLSPELQAAIKGGLERHYGEGLTTNFIERRELIGGMRIQVGSDVYDGSVLAGMKALERSF
jgi:F-type H+-transporting ATPase subunit delta